MMRSRERSVTLAIRGAVAIVFAIAVALLPGATLGLLLAVVGAYAFFDGFVLAVLATWAFASGVRRWWWFALEAFAGMGFGVAALAWPHAATLGLIYLIALWAVVTGVLEIVAGFEVREEAAGVPFVIGGGLSCAFGVALAAFAHLAHAAVAWLIAAYAFAVGSALLVAALRTRHRASK